MKDLARNVGGGVLFYGWLLGSAQLVNHQLMRVPGSADMIARLEMRLGELAGRLGISAGLVKVAFFAAGILLLTLCGWLVKGYVKSKATARLADKLPHNQDAEATNRSVGAHWPFLVVFLMVVILAMGGSGLLFYSCGLFGGIYSWMAGQVGGAVKGPMAQTPAEMLTAIKALAGLLGIWLFMLGYGLAAAARHGPVLKRIDVDGFAWLSERLSWKNWVIGRKIRFLPFLGKAGIHLPDWASNTDANERLCVEVAGRNYPPRDRAEHTWISYNTDQEPHIDKAGAIDSQRVFIRYLMISDGASRTLVRRAYLEESVRRTRAKSARAFGEGFAAAGHCLMCLRFNIKRGDHDDAQQDDGDEPLEDSAGGLDTNTFEQWDKMGLRRLIDWGAGYKMIYCSRAFDVDIDFFGSLVLSRSIALRRKFYVRNADGRIVAKMVERNIFKKAWPILDNDWRIDIYEPDLARDDSFGFVLSLVTQYLRRAAFYDTHACLRAALEEGEGKPEAAADPAG